MRVIITHAHPNTTSPLTKQSSTGSEPATFNSETSVTATHTSGKAYSRPVESKIEGKTTDAGEVAGGEAVASPETTQDLTSSDGTADGEKGGSDDEKLLPDDKDIFGADAPATLPAASTVGSPARSAAKQEPLSITVDDGLRWSAARWERKLTRSRSALDSGSRSFTGCHPSPLRSCPRAAIFNSEGTNIDVSHATDRLLPRWASSKLWQGPTPRSEPGSPSTTGQSKARGFRPVAPTASAEAIARVFERLGKHPRSSSPIPGLDAREAVISSLTRYSKMKLAFGDSGDVPVQDPGGGSCPSDCDCDCDCGYDFGCEGDQREEDALGAPDLEELMGPFVAGVAAAQTGAARDHGLKTRRRHVSPGRAEAGFHQSKQEAVHETSDVEQTPRSVRSSDNWGMRASPAVQRLLESASRRSFEDLPSSSQHTVASVLESDRPPSPRRVLPQMSPESDGEKASKAARALAGWVDSKLQPPLADLGPTPTNGGSRVIAAVGPASRSAKYIETEDLASIPPLKQRGWPPERPVVAGEMEVHDALMEVGDDLPLGPGPGSQPVRKWGSAGTSWGEEAKLALARKRLQWEK